MSAEFKGQLFVTARPGRRSLRGGDGRPCLSSVSFNRGFLRFGGGSAGIRFVIIIGKVL